MPDEKKVVTDPEEALEVGYFGTVQDPTPNEAYTVAGVTSSDTAAQADRRAAAGQMNIAPDPTAESAESTRSKSSSAKKS